MAGWRASSACKRGAFPFLRDTMFPAVNLAPIGECFSGDSAVFSEITHFRAQKRNAPLQAVQAGWRKKEFYVTVRESAAYVSGSLSLASGDKVGVRGLLGARLEPLTPDPSPRSGERGDQA